MIQCLIIDHTSCGAQYWKKFIDYLSLASSFSYAVYASFRHSTENMKMVVSIVELVYFFDMILTFFTDFPKTTSSNQKVNVKDIHKIFWRYLKGDFLLNFIALLPFYLLSLPNGAESVFFLLKLCGRLKRGLSNMDVYKIMQVYQLNEYRRLRTLITKNPEGAMSMDSDQIHINKKIYTKFFLKLIRLLIFMTTVCFFFAVSFKIMLDFQEDYIMAKYPDEVESLERFETYFDMRDDVDVTDHEAFFVTDHEALLIYIYYSFTSLTTVGFGDFNPRSDFERIYIAFGLLFGVAIFSFIMGEFIGMISNIDKYDESAGDNGDELSRFFGILKNYNYNEDIDIKLRREIEDFLENRYSKDQVLALNESQGIMGQLHEEYKNALICKFTHFKFLNDFKRFFDIELVSKNEHSRYTWENVNYREFMIDIIFGLEPIQYKKNDLILQELDEVDKVVFSVAKVHIGYSINRKQIFRLALENPVIGAYGMTFKKRAHFIYKCTQNADCLFIRKTKWMTILKNSNYREVTEQIKKTIKI